MKHSLFTWQWWVILGATLLFWMVWWKLVDTKRIHTILNFGFLIGIIALIFDMVGMNHHAWAYPIRLYWAFIPPLIPYDLTYITTTYMLVYQKYGDNWKKSILSFSVVSAVFSFGAEPLLSWMGIYQMYKWKYIYSFPVYIGMACFVKILMGILNKKQSG